MSKNKDGMSKTRWAELKRRPAQHGTFSHVSARAWMEPNEKDHLLPSKAKVSQGITLNIGRNIAKALSRSSNRGS